MALGNPKLRLLALALVAFSVTAQAKRDEPARLALAADATTEPASPSSAPASKTPSRTARTTSNCAPPTASSCATRWTSWPCSSTPPAPCRRCPKPSARRCWPSRTRSTPCSGPAHADSRLVCTREKEMGSNFRRSVCLTVAQRRRQADSAQQMARPQDAEPRKARRREGAGLVSGERIAQHDVGVAIRAGARRSPAGSRPVLPAHAGRRARRAAACPTR